jgi:GNAT superfamily N-acetyltransferase
MSTMFRDADATDLPAIVAMLADDHLGATREDPTLPLQAGYLAAFEAIMASPNTRLIVAVDGEQVIGTMQLILIPGLSSIGSMHGQIEAVRIAAAHRGAARGEAMVRWAIEECRLAGCSSIQLTSDGSRLDAHRFWQRIGFTASHKGFKLKL